MKKYDYCQFDRGGCRCEILERGISESRAAELDEEIERFNANNADGLYYRGLIDVRAMDE